MKAYKYNIKRIVFFLLLSLVLVTGGCSSQDPPTSSQNFSENSMEVHFLDVGQGDSALIRSGEHTMLIDAGENDQGDVVVSYLKDLGIKRLDYVIGTHPHSDHIGGLDTVIRAFDVGTVILPPKEHTTKTFEDVLDAIEEKGLSITKPVVGTKYSLGNASFCIIAPNGDYGDDLNNWSVGLRITNGDCSFLFTGDAESQAEANMAANGISLKSDVLKLGHHGSSTSSSPLFLDLVDSDYAVITCGIGNSYGHPHKETLEKLEERGIQIFRTDQQGTIIAYSDGSEITWNVADPTSADSSNFDSSDNVETSDDADNPNVPDRSNGTDNSGSSDNSSGTAGSAYVLNTSSKKFHLPDCKSVSKIQPENRQDSDLSREELLAEGYTACKNCNP